MRRPTVLLVIALFVMLLTFSKTAFACGTMEDWVNAYYGKGFIGHANKKEALAGINSCAAGYYKKGTSDRLLLPVILDALENIDSIEMMSIATELSALLDPDNKYSTPGAAKFLIEEIYHKFYCLKGASDMEGYSTIAKALGTASCPGENIIKLKVKAKNFAFIRMSPGGKKNGHAINGTIVHLVAWDGEWVKIVKPGDVMNYSKTTILGYVHSSLLEKIK